MSTTATARFPEPVRLRVSPWRVDDEQLPDLHPDRPVWALRLSGGSCDGLWSDVAWLTPEGHKEHYWITHGPLDPDEESVEVFETTVREFLEHIHHAMNPFDEIGRMEAHGKWIRYWSNRKGDPADAQGGNP